MANLNSPSDFFGWEGQSQQGTPTDQMGAATTALFPWEVSQPQASQSNEFVKGLQFGWKQTEALGHAALGAGGALFGADEFAINQMNQYQQLMNEANQFAPEVGSIEEIDSLPKFVSWAAANLGQQVPIIAATVATGGIGSVIGRLVAGRIVSGPVAEYLANKAASWGLQSTAQAGARIGAGVGAYLGASGIETGSTFGEQADALKNTGQPLRPGVAITAGLAKGVLEMATPLELAGIFHLNLPMAEKLGGTIAEAMANKGILSRMALAGGSVMATEGLTEGLQEVIDVGARKFVDDNYDALGPDARSRVLNSAAAGGIVGAVFGGLGGIRRQEGRAPVEEQGNAQPEARAPLALPPPAAPGTVEAQQQEVPLLPAPTPDNLNTEAAAATPQPELPEKTGLQQPYVLFNQNGAHVINPDVETAREVMLTEALVPKENRTPAQQVLMRQEEARRAQMFHQHFVMNPEASPQFKNLVDLRNRVLTDNTFRDKEGNLLPEAQKKVDQISQVIETKAKDEGLDITPQSQLSDMENQRYSMLMEKDRTEGLSQREYDQLEKLISKANGETVVQRVKATDEAVAQLEKDIAEGEKQQKPLYSGPATAATLGMSQQEFEQAVAPVRVQNEGNIRMVNSEADLPAGALRDHIMSRGIKQYGLYDYKTDTSYFFLNNLNKDLAVKTYMHEVFVHHGIRKGLPIQAWKDVFNVIKRTRQDALNRYLEDRKIEKTQANYEMAAEEYVAKIAENGTDMPLLRKIIAVIRQFLRSIFPNMSITNDEIRAWIGDTRKSLAGANIQNISPVQNAKVYFSLQEDADELANAVPQGYTMRIMDRIPKKEWITRSQVEQGMKAIGANKAEYSIVNEVLALPYMGEKFQRRTFEHELLQRVMPLQTEAVDEYAEYGLERIGYFGFDRRIHAQNEGQYIGGTRSRLYQVPFETPADVNHFNDDHYIGHTRSFDLGDTRHIVEVQSDLAQKLDTKPLSEAQIAALQTQKATFDGIYNEARGLAKEYGQFRASQDIPAGWITRATNAINSYRAMTGETVRNLSGPNAIYDVLTHIYHAADDRAADIGLRINAAKQGAALAANVEWNRLAPSIYKRMLREETRLAAEAAYDKVRLATVKTLGLVEGWYDNRNLALYQNRTGKQIYSEQDILNYLAYRDSLNEGGSAVMAPVAGIAKRHAELLKWAAKEFGGTEVTDAQGNTWLEWKAKDSPVIAYASDAGQDSFNLGKELNAKDQQRSENLDKWNKLWQIKILTRVLTPIQLAKRYALEPINRYIETVNRWANTKTEIIAPADELVKKWQLLGKNDANRLASTIMEITQKSDELGRKLTQEEEGRMLQGLSPQALEIYGDLNKSFDNVLTRLERGLKYIAARETLGSKKLADDFMTRWEQTKTDQQGRQDLVTKLTLEPRISVNLVSRMHKIEKEISQMRNRNYFPYTRFGQYTITVTATKDGMKFEGKPVENGKTAAFWTFESRAAQKNYFNNASVKNLLAQGFDVNMSQMKDEQYGFLGMPPSLMDALQKEIEMSATQQEQLKEFFIRHSPGRAFLRHLIQRKGIAGFSLDAMRVYASYMMGAANQLARVEHYADMDSALHDLYDMRNSFEQRTGDSTGLVEIYNAFQRHRKYIMNPGNDLAKYRAMGFMWYLGFNPKSALVNLTQTPMVTYPWLAARYGDLAAVSELTKAIKDAAAFTQGKASFDPMLDQLYARGIKEGFLDESLATELAGISEGGTLQRVLPSTEAGRLLNQVSYYGSWMFRQAEKFTRAIAFIAATRMEFAKTQDMEKAYLAGRDAVRSTLFEYAKWNRPEFMRGKKSVFFLFWNFMQHMSFAAFGGEGAGTAMRIWLMLAVVAGLQGLPYAEDLLDLLDFGSTKVKQMLGMKNPYTDLRTNIRELLTNITDNPDLIMHGLSRYWGLGPLHALELAGIPIPHTDVSASTSMGRVIPGLQEMLGPSSNPDEKFGRSIAQIMGPVFGMPYILWKSYEDTDPNSWKKWERAMPTAMKSLSRAARFLNYGEESFRGGGTVAAFDPHDTEQQAEVYAQAFGFSPTRINQRYELRAAQEQMKEYMMVKRSMLLDEYSYARQVNDREGLADVRKRIQDFNRVAPDPKLHITHDVLARSTAQRVNRAKLRTRGQPAETSLKGLYREIAQSYPETGL